MDRWVGDSLGIVGLGEAGLGLAGKVIMVRPGQE